MNKRLKNFMEEARKIKIQNREIYKPLIYYEDAFKTLNDEKMIRITLSNPKKIGWPEVRLNPTDSRKRLYELIGRKMDTNLRL